MKKKKKKTNFRSKEKSRPYYLPIIEKRMNETQLSLDKNIRKDDR